LTGFTVGFDLDLTLVDSRPGIAATFRTLSARTGVPIDVDLVVSRLGPPLEWEMAYWYPAERVSEVADLYRALYPTHAITPSPALPGAAEAVRAVRDSGGQVIVVTAKAAELARLHLAQLDLTVTEVYGSAWADGKAEVLRTTAASAFVGDHTADMAAARAAGVLGVGVLTGPASASQLAQAGADVVLDDLRGFPAWLAEIQLGRRVSGG
jgi:phosphoglycolate phosphatase